MTRVRWIYLVLLCLAVSQSDGRGGRGGRRGGSGGEVRWDWNIYFGVLGVVIIGVAFYACLKARENHDGSRCILGIHQDVFIWLCFAPPLGILFWVGLLCCSEQE